jgi:hypothetical protein
MSTTDSTECDWLKVAVAKMVALPGLSVKDAMLIAKFTDNEVENKSLQGKVLQHLPGKGKRNMRELARECTEEGSIIQAIDVENEKNSDLSPITDNSATSLLKSDGSQKQKSRRLIVSQKQLMNASTAGKKFTVMGGNHLTSDDILIAAERSLRDKEKGRLLALKKKCVKAAMIEEKGKLVIETKGTDCNGWLVHELEAVLAWYGVQKMSLMGKQQKIEKWREIQSKNGQPARIERWMDELEQQLITASKTDIAIGDTAVGRYEQRKMEDFKLAAPKFTNEQWAIMNAERERHATNQGLGGDP